MEPRLSARRRCTEAVLDTIRANEFKACYIRPIVYRGYHTLGVNPFPCPVDTAILLVGMGRLSRAGRAENGVDVRISSWARAAPNTFPTLAKTSANYANSQLIKMEAIAEGYSEGIALDTAGYLSEGSGQNLFVVRDNVIYTPPLTASILPGITRDSVHHARPRPRLHASARRCCRASCSTSPTRRSSPARRSRSRRSGRWTRSRSATAGAGRSPKRSSSAFFDVINGEAPDQHGWLSYVYPGEPLQAAAAAGRAQQAAVARVAGRTPGSALDAPPSATSE